MNKLASLALLLSLAACGDNGLGTGEDMGDPCLAHTTGETCRAATGCVISGCPDCQGGTSFQGCYTVGKGPAVTCPAIACAPPCEQLTTAASCEAQPGCHSVYVDPMTCDCIAPGCCMQFSTCSSAPVYCTPPSGGTPCGQPTPACAGDYTVGYTTGCYEGCVKKSACP